MTTKRKAGSRILDAVHETARDLPRLGFMDKRKMRKYDVRPRRLLDLEAYDFTLKTGVERLLIPLHRSAGTRVKEARLK